MPRIGTILILATLAGCGRSPSPSALTEADCLPDEVIQVPLPIPDEDAPDYRYGTQMQVLFAVSAVTTAPLLPRLLPDAPRHHAAAEGVLDLPCSSVHPEARAILRRAALAESYIDAFEVLKNDLLQSGLYGTLRNFQRPAHPIPETARELFHDLGVDFVESELASEDIERLRDLGWRVRVLEPSRVKARARALLRPPAADRPRVSIALTLEPRFLTDGAARILETEIIMGREPSANRPENADFFVYGENGALARCSVFFTGRSLIRASTPHSCASCHMDFSRRATGFAPASFRGGATPDWSHPQLDLDALEDRLVDACNR